MKKIFTLILVSLLSFSCSESFKKRFDIFSKKAEIVELSEGFIQGSEDIPLLVGMERVSEDSIGFDSNSGSIISIEYVSESNATSIKNFYIKTLPQMGWEIVKNLESKVVFKRDNEDLEIEFSKGDDDIQIVNFFMSSSI